MTNYARPKNTSSDQRTMRCCVLLALSQQTDPPDIYFDSIHVKICVYFINVNDQPTIHIEEQAAPTQLGPLPGKDHGRRNNRANPAVKVRTPHRRHLDRLVWLQTWNNFSPLDIETLNGITPIQITPIPTNWRKNFQKPACCGVPMNSGKASPCQ